MRQISLLGILTAANFITAVMGLPLVEGGKFTVSNIMPIVFAAVAAPLFLAEEKRVDRRVIWFLLAFNGAALLSFLIFLIRFGWEPNFPVLAFQDVELIFCLLLVWFARNHYDTFRSAVRAGIYASLVVVAYYGWLNYSARDWEWSFGMDDRSHTAVLFACEAYILIRFYGSRLDCTVAVGLLLLTIPTVSRESVFFVPAILIALVTRSRYGAVLAVSLVGGMTVALWIAGDALVTTFYLLDRLSSVESAAGGSTVAHLLLILSALDMKFSDVWCFLFGIGPGNYSKALTTFQTMLPQIQALDPALAEGAQVGRAPMHSLPASLLLDMNIALFLLCLYFLTRALRYLLRTRSVVDLLFALGLLGASMFYSLHNKPYIYLIVTTLIILQPVERQKELGLSGNLASDRRLRAAPGQA
jgi:hypothetical protein